MRINKVYEILGNEDEVAMANNIGKLISELHFNKSEYFKGFEVDDNPYIDIAFFWRRFDNDGLTIVNEFINKYNDFCKLMSGNTKIPTGCEVISPEIVEFSYTDDRREDL